MKQNSMPLFKTWVYFILGTLPFFLACEKISTQSEVVPQESSCQNCHDSPPLTGEHELHLFKITGMPKQITCYDCHQNSIAQVYWETSAQKKKVKQLMSWDNFNTDFPSFIGVSPKVDTLSYSLCLTEVRSEKLYAALWDSITPVVAVIPGTDSVYLGGSQIKWFKFDSSYIRMDTIGTGPQPLIIPVTINVYKDPTLFNNCEHQLKNDSIIEINNLNYNQEIRSLSSQDLILERKETNKRFILSPDFNYTDTIQGKWIPPESTFLGNSSDSSQGFYTVFEDEDYVLRVYDTTTRTMGGITREFIDTLFFQIEDNILYELVKDSQVVYGNNLFARPTSLHMNGKVEISFAQEKQTLYMEDTVAALLDSITGDTLGFEILKSGVWSPKKTSCWNTGLNATNCHENTDVSRNWNRPNIMKPF